MGSRLKPKLDNTNEETAAYKPETIADLLPMAENEVINICLDCGFDENNIIPMNWNYIVLKLGAIIRGFNYLYCDENGSPDPGKLNTLFESVYLPLLYRFNEKCTLYGFSDFAGIPKDYITRQANKEKAQTEIYNINSVDESIEEGTQEHIIYNISRCAEKYYNTMGESINCTYTELRTKIDSAAESTIADIMQNGGKTRNTVGLLAELNFRHGWNNPEGSQKPKGNNSMLLDTIPTLQIESKN